MNRAYSTLEIKAVADATGKRMFSGIASTPQTDRMGDIVEPKGAEFTLPIPLLWQHDARDPIGWITSAKVSAKGIEIQGEIATIDEEGPLKARLLHAWQMLKSKLVRGLSIGFKPLEHSLMESGGYRIMKWSWLELSAVTIAANADCSITAIKSIDDALLAASGHKQSKSTTDHSPGASGTEQSAQSGILISRSPKGKIMQTLNEKLNELRTVRTEKAARMTEIAEQMKADASIDVTEFDTLESEITDLDTQIRIKRVESMNAASARPVDGASSAAASQSRGPTILVKKADPDDKFKGQGFTRLAIAKAAAYIAMREGNFITPVQVAEARWGKSHPALVGWIKAAVAGGGTGAGEWGAELAQSDTRFNGDFVEFLYAQTVFDRLPLRSMPARVHVKGQDGAATGYWVGESKAIPLTKPDFSDVELNPLKVGAIAACSKELVMDSDPSAEMWIRDSLVQALAQRTDTTFLSSAAAVAGVSPAGILNGVTALTPSGTDAAAVRADLNSLYGSFITAKNAGNLVQIMTPSMAKTLSLMVNALGQSEFTGLNANGGTFQGDPVFTGENVTAGDWILLKPSDIWKIGDSGIQVSMSDQAMIEQNDAPLGAGDTPIPASATLMSLWQTEQVGFKVVRRINYAKRRAGAVAAVAAAAYAL